MFLLLAGCTSDAPSGSVGVGLPEPGEPMRLELFVFNVEYGGDATTDADYLIWNYTGLHASGTDPPVVEGSLTFDDSTMGRPWPLPPGRYVAHYLVMDRYRSIGSATFAVR